MVFGLFPTKSIGDACGKWLSAVCHRLPMHTCVRAARLVTHIPVHRLPFEVLVYRDGTLLATDDTLLHAAVRRFQVRAVNVVDPDRSRFQPPRGQEAISLVRAEEICAQAADRVVGKFEGLLQVIANLHNDLPGASLFFRRQRPKLAFRLVVLHFL
jgi:hypothetical protein